MRIITGSAKGIKLKAPKGLDVRPTADRVKGSVFNILVNLAGTADGSIIQGARVLDLFAGTGNLGLEALSRGACHALFVDYSPASLQAIRENIVSAKLGNLAEVVRENSVKMLDKLAQNGRTFTLVFVDPPYNQGLVGVVLTKLDCSTVLIPGGIIVVEHSKHEVVNSDWHYLQLIRTERYGETVVSFLQQSHNITTGGC